MVINQSPWPAVRHTSVCDEVIIESIWCHGCDLAAHFEHQSLDLYWFQQHAISAWKRVIYIYIYNTTPVAELVHSILNQLFHLETNTCGHSYIEEWMIKCQ